MAGDLHAAALEALLLEAPEAKCTAASALQQALANGTLAPCASAPPRELPMPGRPARPRLVAPRELPQRGLGSVEGRAAFLHAIAHIEFNAINLGLDAVYRFRGMPAEFYADWATVAADEARHFRMLAGRLRELDTAYGDFDAHNGLWDMACRTADDVMVRMALVPRVLEARGLDVTPGMIERLKKAGDEVSARILETILAEEVAHVAAGTRWLEWCCQARGLDPQITFLCLLEERCPGAVRPPFNREARRAAGFSAAELQQLESSGSGLRSGKVS